MTLARKFVFVSQEAWAPSEKMLGIRLLALLKRAGINATKVSIDDLQELFLRDALIMFIKTWPTELVEKLQAKGNKVLIMLTDLIATDRLHHVNPETRLSGVIYPTQRCRKDYAHVFKNAGTHAVLPHFWDARFKPNNAKSFRVAFVGSKPTINWEMHLNKIAFLETVAPDEKLFKSAKDYACHFSVRMPNTLSALYKPQSKLFTAAACRANIVASRDAGFIEILPDYPFYTDGTYEDTIQKLELAKASFASKIWKEALEKLTSLEESYGENAFLKAFLSIANECCDR